MSSIDKNQGQDFLNKLTRLRKFSGGGHAALHKPVMLLYALSEFAHRNADAIRYRAAETVVAPILAKFGPPGTRARVADPFTRLEGDGFWILRSGNRDEMFDKSGNPRPGQLNKFDAEAGFDDKFLLVLHSQSQLVTEAVHVVSETHIDAAIRREVLMMVGWDRH
jgi:putative restriction endonuclease